MVSREKANNLALLVVSRGLGPFEARNLNNTSSNNRAERAPIIMHINGIAHTQLTVSDFKKSLPFYKALLQFFEMTLIFENDSHFYCVGGRTGIAISQASPEYKSEKFNQQKPGLHHLCFRLRSREDVDSLHQFVIGLGAKIIRSPQKDDKWAPGYYSLLFEDPDGIRLEANFIPGKGNLDSSVTLPKKWKEWE